MKRLFPVNPPAATDIQKFRARMVPAVMVRHDQVEEIFHEVNLNLYTLKRTIRHEFLNFHQNLGIRGRAK